MELFRRLYLACLGGTMGLAVFTGFLFLKLDIRTAWRVLMGRSGRKREKMQLEKQNKREKKFSFSSSKKRREAEQMTVFLDQTGGER